jgi:hypothetical protein
MVLPPSPASSRLAALKNARNQRQQQQNSISDYLRKSSPIPHRPSSSTSSTSTTVQQRQKPVLSETIQNNASAQVHSNKILDGVVACLDVR